MRQLGIMLLHLIRNAQKTIYYIFIGMRILDVLTCMENKHKEYALNINLTKLPPKEVIRRI